VSGSLSPRPAFTPDKPAAVHTQAETVDHSQAQAGGLHEAQFGEHAQPAAEDSAAATPSSPEAAALESVAGDHGHANGSEDAEPAHHGGDAEGARLIALNMALHGPPCEETERYLSENFHLADTGGLLDEVYASVES
jgi:hypothetical protein